MTARDLLLSLLDPLAVLPEELRPVALLARAGARAATDDDLAAGSVRDGLHLDEAEARALSEEDDDRERSDAELGMELAAAEAELPEELVWRAGVWEVYSGTRADGATLVLLVGPDPAELVVQGTRAPLSPRVWVEVPLVGAPREIWLQLSDGRVLTLRR